MGMCNKNLLNIFRSGKDSINMLIDDLLGKEDKRQGITTNEKPSTISYLYTASGYVRSLLDFPGTTEQQLIKNTEDKLNVVLYKINAFYENDWLKYRESVEKLELSPFKEFESFKLD